MFIASRNLVVILSKAKDLEGLDTAGKVEEKILRYAQNDILARLKDSESIFYSKGDIKLWTKLYG